MKANLFDYIFLLRPLILIPVWNFLLIGSYLARQEKGFTIEIVFALLIYTLIMGGIYILNQLLDIETDRANKKLFILSEGFIPVKHAWLEMALCWIVGIGFSFRFGFLFLLFIIISLFFGIIYSVPPFKLKGRPILDTLSNGIGYGMINFGIGWLIFKPFDWTMFLKFLPYLLSICAVFVNTTVVDIEGDKKTGEITTGVFLKEKGSFLTSTILQIAAIIMAAILKDPISLIPAAVSLPLFIYVTSCAFLKNRLDRKFTIASFRFPGLILTVITSYLYPAYLLLLVVVLMGMRIYYKNRFGISYPTLTGG